MIKPASSEKVVSNAAFWCARLLKCGAYWAFQFFVEVIGEGVHYSKLASKLASLFQN